MYLGHLVDGSRSRNCPDLDDNIKCTAAHPKRPKREDVDQGSVPYLHAVGGVAVGTYLRYVLVKQKDTTHLRPKHGHTGNNVAATAQWQKRHGDSGSWEDADTT